MLSFIELLVVVVVGYTYPTYLPTYLDTKTNLLGPVRVWVGYGLGGSHIGISHFDQYSHVFMLHPTLKSS